MRGQVMLEFVMIVAVAIIIGMIYLVAVQDLIKDTSNQQKTTELNSIGYTIQDELILATSMADGYMRTFSVPDMAGRFVYSLSGDGKSVTLVSGDTTIAYECPNYSGTIVKGNNVISKNGALQVN